MFDACKKLFEMMGISENLEIKKSEIPPLGVQMKFLDILRQHA